MSSGPLLDGMDDGVAWGSAGPIRPPPSWRPNRLRLDPAFLSGQPLEATVAAQRLQLAIKGRRHWSHGGDAGAARLRSGEFINALVSQSRCRGRRGSALSPCFTTRSTACGLFLPAAPDGA